MQTWNDVNNYKPCRKKQYEIWACMPPAGTIVVNKLEQPEAVKMLGKKTYFTGKDLTMLQQRNPSAIAQLQGMVQRGMVYCTKAGDMVLSGTRGELWVTSKEKVAKTYQVFINGNWSSDWGTLFSQRGITQGDAHLLPWVKVHANGEASSMTMACFVPKNERGQIKTSWAVLNINAQGVEHGLGDFVVCMSANGKPNMNDRWVVNGAVFADTYNNQGWANCVQPTSELYSAPEPAPLFDMPATGENKEFNKDLYNFVGQLAQKCAQAQHRELSFRVKPGEKPNEILIQASTIVDFANKNSSSEFKTVGVQTRITVNSNNTVTFVNRLMNDAGQAGSTMFEIQIPNGVAKDAPAVDPTETANFLQNNVEVIFGLCGFVREVGVRGAFAYSTPPSKGDYDGIRDYTMTSGATNRKLRGLTFYTNEQHGEGMSSAIRTIANCDSLFNKVETTRPLRVFRGEPYEQRTVDCGGNFANLEGFVSVNTAYSSTTLNVQSAPMFAKSRGAVNGVVGGIIWAIDLPAGSRAHYAHNSAGWKQQYEILLDRCYDLQAGGVILEFRDSGGCTYKVVQATLVPHQPFGEINPVQSAPLRKMQKLQYNQLGRVDFQSEYSEGVLHEAFNKIRERGYSDIQWQKAWDSTREILHNGSDGKPAVNTRSTAELIGKEIAVGSMIVLRANNPDTDKLGIHIDYGIRLHESGMALIIHKLSGKTSLRQNHGDAEDLRWSEYGVNMLKFDNSYDDKGVVTKVNGATDINEFDQHLYEKSGRDQRNVIALTTGTSDEIASKIIEWAKRHKDVCLLPLIDVGRYFDTTFAAVLNEEGYELMRSIRVERHYDKNSQAQANDPQAGYVPCKYQITGDNDDHLVIDVKFERDKDTKRLKISYRGQSQGTKVNESKALTVSVFSGEHMYNLAKSIIYTFAKRMHLSKSRKFDNLLKYFCYQSGYSLGRPKKKDENVLVNYRVWTPDGKSNFNVDIIKQDAERHQVVVEFEDGKVQIIDMDFSDTIFALYRQFCLVVIGDDQNADAT